MANILSEMIGRIQSNGLSVFLKSARGFWGNDITVDYSRNDYDLYKAVYFSSVIGSKGKEYVMGASFAKPIINSTTAFTLGSGLDITVDGSNVIDQHSRAEDKLKQWLQDNYGLIFDFTKFGFRDGDAFVHIDQDANIEILDPKSVEIRYDPTSGQVTGFDITETAKEDDLNITYIREFRRYTITYNRLEPGQKLGDAGTVIYDVYSTTDGLISAPVNENGEQDMSLLPELVEMPNLVIHLANEPEPKAIYGNSDLQNLLAYMQSYATVMNGAIKNNKYNNTPIPVITGTKGDSSKRGKNPITWGNETVIYLTGEGASAKFLQATGVMEDTGKLLEYLFYNIVQASETPEFIFGTAVASSNASTESQMPVMIKKTERKRALVKPVLLQIIEALIFRQVQMGDPDFYAIYTTKTPVDVSFAPIVDEDKKLTLETLTLLVDKGIISDKTALELSSVGNRISNVDDELKAARDDAEGALSRGGTLPFQPNRIRDELNSNDELNADGSVGDEA